MSSGCRIARVAALAMVAGLAACGQALPAPPLTDMINLPGGLLSSEQQKKAIQDLTEKKATHEVEVARQIEKAR